MKKELIKERRKELGLTLEDVAQEVGVSKATIQRYESGVIENIPANNIKKICDILIISPQKLMGWEEIDSNTSIISLLHEIKKELQDIHSILEPKKKHPKIMIGDKSLDELMNSQDSQH